MAPSIALVPGMSRASAIDGAIVIPGTVAHRGAPCCRGRPQPHSGRRQTSRQRGFTDGDFDAFAGRHPALLGKRLLGRHYRSATLASARARQSWVEPDLSHREPAGREGEHRPRLVQRDDSVDIARVGPVQKGRAAEAHANGLRTATALGTALAASRRAGVTVYVLGWYGQGNPNSFAADFEDPGFSACRWHHRQLRIVQL